MWELRSHVGAVSDRDFKRSQNSIAVRDRFYNSG